MVNAAIVEAGPPVPDWMKPAYPFRTHRYSVGDDARMNFVDEGPRGDTAVLMLHGNPTWSFYYRNLIAALAPTIRCISPDHIGMGLSDKPRDYRYTLEQRIADLESLVSRLGLKRLHIVVHDWGGAIGFGFATRHPEMVERIVILNTAAFPAPHIPARISVCRVPLLGPVLVRGLNGFAGPAVHMAMNRRAMDEGTKRAFLFPYDSWANRVAVNAFVQDIPMSRSHPTFATLAGIEEKLPLFRDRRALILWGGKDFCFNDYFFNRWTGILPSASRHYVPDGGHYVLEDVQEAVPAVSAFLTAT